MSFDFSTLVTDRTQEDVEYVKQLVNKLVSGTATEAELAEWNSFTLKGSYNHTDLNRVTAAMDDLKARLESYGYAVPGYQRIKINHKPPTSGGGGEIVSQLPDDYIELSCIESTGTQYINTGFKMNQDSRVVMKAQPTVEPSPYGWLFDGRDTGGKSSKGVIFFNGDWCMDYNVAQSATRYHFTTISPLDVLNVDYNKNQCTINGETGTFTPETFQSSADLVLLALNTAGTVNYFVNAKLYTCQVYDNGTLIRDFVPCINPVGDVGLFDLVSQQFYGNAGTGAFIQGDRVGVTLPANYSRLTYIASTGTQYIDTGVIPNQNIKMVVDAQLTSVSGTVSFAGSRNSESSDGDGAYFSWISVSGNLRSYYYNSFVVVATADTARHVYTKDKNQTLVDGSLLNTATAQPFRSSKYPIYLFANNEGKANFHASVRIYSCQIYDNETIVRDFIPCINPSGNVGLYDLVTGTFFGNSGTGVFKSSLDFSNCDWDYVVEACKENKIPSFWNVGDQKTMTINGSEYMVDIIGMGHDIYSDGSGVAPITFQLHDCYATKYPMNSSGTNSGGWKSSVLRTSTLPSILELMPSVVSGAIKEVDKLSSAGSQSATIVTTADKLFLLSEVELFGSLSYSHSGEGSQYSYYKNGGSKVKKVGDSADHWWERSPYTGNTASFCMVYNTGAANTNTASYNRGVSFAFCFACNPSTEQASVYSREVKTIAKDYDTYTWYEFDNPTPETMNMYLLNVAAIRDVISVMKSTPSVPSDVSNFMTQEANDIEKILVDINLLLTFSRMSLFYSGDLFSGEV